MSKGAWKDLATNELPNVILSGIACSGDGTVFVAGYTGDEKDTVSKGHVFQYSPPGGNNTGPAAIVAPVSKNDDSSTGRLSLVQMGEQVNGADEFADRAQPMSMVFDEEGALFICDQKAKCILSRSPVEKTQQQLGENIPMVHSLVAEFEGKALLGPNALCFDSRGTLYFTDSGPHGSFSAPKGSVFCVSIEDQMLKALAFQSIAYPGGIACEPSGSLIYVSETHRNRILRFARRSNGVFYSSVWHSFNGGFGPTSLLEHEGILYVARADLTGAMPGSMGGCICLINEQGDVMNEVATPGPEVFGMCFNFDNEEGTTRVMITERSTKTVWQIELTDLQPVIADEV